jgi:hypothetical protein
MMARLIFATKMRSRMQGEYKLQFVIALVRSFLDAVAQFVVGNLVPIRMLWTFKNTVDKSTFHNTSTKIFPKEVGIYWHHHR